MDISGTHESLIPIRSKSDSSSLSSSSSDYDRQLRLATEKNPVMLMELDQDGTIRYLSDLWDTLIGPRNSTHIADLIVGSDEDRYVFHRAMEMMLINDELSYTVTFNVLSTKTEGTASDEASDLKDKEKIRSEGIEFPCNEEAYDDNDIVFDDSNIVTLEACGILIRDNETQLISHSMWTVKPYVQKMFGEELDSILPPDFIKKLGFGATIFADYLKEIAEEEVLDERDLPSPKMVLCRVCESFVPAWWLETHSEHCVCEHRLDSLVHLLHDNLVEASSLLKSDSILEYKQLTINVRSSTARMVLQSLQDLCDIAVNINTSEIRLPNNTEATTEDILLNPLTLTQGYQRAIYDFSPNTKWNIENVQAWQISMKEEMEREPGLSLLAHDTIDLAKKKVDAVLRLDNAMTYSLKIKNEINNWVLQLILIQIENNKINLQHNDGCKSCYSPNISTPKKSLEMQAQPPAQLRNIEKTNNSDFLEEAFTSSAMVPDKESDNLPKFESPQPHRGQGEIFADSYLMTDSIPEKNKEESIRGIARIGRNDSAGNSSYSNLSGTRFGSKSLSRSLTPRQRLDDQQNVYHNSNNSFSDRRDLSMSDVTENMVNLDSNASVPSIISTKPNSFVGSSLLPKLKSTISLTPGRNSPLPSLTAGQLSRRGSVSKLGNDKSPMSSSSNSGPPRDYLTPEQHPSASSLPKQPLSPLLLATNQIKSTVSNIKDYDILKPISKGAYGSVYLARKKLTGDYFAIKVLKKSDMIAKNQITNVKSERAIMMVQSDKPYVARLYASFQNKDNLFLVMEYLPGGDLAMLIKMMGFLPEKWAKQYISEVIVGVDDMHQNSIIHHDLKPDNLLIDSNGHVKLTDFGLSRAGLVRRHLSLPRSRRVSLSISNGDPNFSSLIDLKGQEGPFNDKKRSNSNSSGMHRSTSHNRKNSYKQGDIEQRHSSNSVNSSHSINMGDITLRESFRNESISSSHSNTDISALQRSDSQASFSLLNISRPNTPTPPVSDAIHARNNSNASDIFSDTPTDLALFHPEDSKQDKSFFGTPDYLAPETIEGTGEDDQCDWWSVGCILFELLYGYPPFHSSTPEEVFKKILGREIQWPTYFNLEEQKEFDSSLAKDLITKLLVLDPSERLGYNGAQEIKEHPYFKDVDWDHVYEEEASFVPAVEHPESTDYFDLRGAVLEDFGDEEGESISDVVPGFTPLLGSEESARRHSASFSGAQGEYSPNTPLNKLCVSSVLESVSKENSNRSSPLVKHFPLAIPPHMRERRISKLNDSQTEFGSFYFRNLSALDKANKDAINRLKSEHLTESPGVHRRSSSASHVSSSSDSSNPKTRAGKVSTSGSPGGCHAPSKSFSVFDSPTMKVSSPDISVGTDSAQNSRKGSGDNNNSSTSSSILHFNDESPTATKLKSPLSPTYAASPCMTPSHPIRNRLMTKSSSQRRGSADISMDENDRLLAISRVNSLRFRRRSRRKSSASNEISYHMDVLVCEPISIHRYRVSKDLESLGCSVVSVGAGDELISRATSGVKFDLIITALKIPKLGAVDIVRLLKHTNGANCMTPVVAITNYYQEAMNGNVFDDVIEKPVVFDQLRKVIAKYALEKVQHQEDTIISDSDLESNA